MAHSDKNTKRKRSKKPRFKLQFRFWLDMLKDDELLIAETIDDLKDRRLFAPTVRDGIKLMVSLRDENTIEVLEAMFPWIRDYYAARSPSPANQEFQSILQQQADILARLSNNTAPRLQLEDPPDINIFKGSDDHSDPSEARQTFTQGMGDLFGEDEDDLW